MTEHSVHRGRWDALTTDDLYAVVRLRNRVFALEQRVTAEDFDGRDREPETEHWWIPGEDGVARAYLRCIRPAADEVQPAVDLPATRVIGRVATAVEHRGQGLARRLVDAVLAAHPDEAFLLHAQEYVAGLYAAAGFVPFGEPYVEAGIRHVGMYRAAAVGDDAVR
ncbi:MULTISPECIES: GNAT family N-acetyltransferase [unclassified Curtobacterium]|uniref:GNAT family N-acetyltransferase n=1 Tax=unclassified Curtobacterium TaxID=257496 RepID=UPI000DA9A6F3|nr:MULTISPECIES: GNAT family N-acetyltransferase [unclassified Curtobacterium]PZE27174.1 GNAT family N-acetyltransferase [Curtobacterium sp. MCBD17_028]PZE74728.1 GNAT family N-acetyltransferase [Curtobacterium sp. MCBD17_019]WIB63237.1 GNAT family N-acetyltransferase [Curtobacterium sp. MCBD17_040]WIE54260.1 GNAT family N-acetyltransferase [Curtobacterium sp. MCBD17_003]